MKTKVRGVLSTITTRWSREGSPQSGQEMEGCFSMDAGIMMHRLEKAGKLGKLPFGQRILNGEAHILSDHVFVFYFDHNGNCTIFYPRETCVPYRLTRRDGWQVRKGMHKEKGERI